MSCTAARASGVSTPITGTSSVCWSSRSAVAVAELQATTISFTPSRASQPAISWAQRAQLVRRAPSVGEARGVAGVEKVLVRHGHEALVEDRQASHAGVEHADRTLRVHVVDGSRRVSERAARLYDPHVRLLCIHHEPTSDGGTLLEPARAGGWAIEHWRANAGEPRPILDGVDAVIAYGGTMNPDDDERLAWLADVRATLAEAVARDLPVLGVCLGAQLLSQALGAGAPRLERPELGWYQVEVTGGRGRRRADRTAGARPARSSSGTTTAASCRRAPCRWRAPSARRSRPTASAMPSGRCSSTSTSTPTLVERWTGFAPELVRAHGSEPADLVARARAYETEYVALSRALMSRFLTVARTREARPVA